MDFKWTPEQEQIREAARHLTQQFSPEYWRRCDHEERFPQEFWDACGDAGFMGVMMPPEYGGSGLGVTEACLILQEVARSDAGMDGSSTVHLSIFGMNPVVKHGTEEQKRKYLPAAAQGRLHVSFAVTEPDAGTDTTRIRTFAERRGDMYVIHGRKVFITKAQEAERLLLLARTMPYESVQRKTDGMSLFLAPVDRAKITIRDIPKMGRNAVDTNELFIEGLEVEAKDLVGQENRGFYQLLDGLNPERIMIAVEALGIGFGAVERAVRYANERVVFGRPIGTHQGIQMPLADAYSHLKAAELLVYHAAWLYDAGKPCGAEANMAKLRASEAACWAVDAAFQTFGGYAYAREYDIERLYRQVRMTRIVPVSNEMVKNFIGEHVLGMPKSY